MTNNKSALLVIADGGATKTDWRIIKPNGEIIAHSTGGINFNVTPEQEIAAVIKSLPDIINQNNVVFNIFAAGYSSAEEKVKLKSIIQTSLITSISEINIESDIIGAVKACSNDVNGLVCILGTGSNTVLNLNGAIIQKTPSLGYILGDEGSGSHIGKMLLQDYLYGIMPENEKKMFYDEFNITKEIVIEYTYRKPNAGTYLASFAKFAVKNKQNNYIKHVVEKSLQQYISIHLLQYPEFKKLETHFVGSVAHFFNDTLEDLIKKNGGKLGNVIQSPIEGLVKYYLKLMPNN